MNVSTGHKTTESHREAKTTQKAELNHAQDRIAHNGKHQAHQEVGQKPVDKSEADGVGTSSAVKVLGGLGEAFGGISGASKTKEAGKTSFRDLAKVRPKPVNPSAPGQENVDRILDQVNTSGDLSQLNQIDNFRSHLTPAQQKRYDQQLEKLRNDPNIEFNYRDGAEPNAALEDIAFRGIAAANFNNPKIEKDVIKDSKDVDGKLNIYVYPDNVPLGDFHEGNTGESGGLATPSNDIAVGQGNVRGYLAQGENVYLHEFSHLQQRVRADGKHESGRVPGDFPDPKAFEKAFADPKFQDYLVEKYAWLGAKKPEDGSEFRGGQESWPSVQALYHEFPEELKKASPELYELMSSYTGFDTVAQTETKPRRKPTGSWLDWLGF